MARPSQLPGPSLSATAGPTRTSDSATRMNTADAEGEAEGDQPDLPPRPALVDVVRAVERADNRDECRRTAPQRAGDPEREQPAVVVVGESPHLFLNEFEDLRRNERTERASDVVRDVREGKEAGEREQKQDRRKQRQEEVVGELSR